MSGRDHVDPTILQKIDNCGLGIEISRIPDGAKLEVQTKNTLYKLTKISDNRFTIEGGSFFSEPTEVQITGSTLSFQGSMIKVGWIVESMYLEIIDCYKTIGTSHIKSIKLL